MKIIHACLALLLRWVADVAWPTKLKDILTDKIKDKLTAWKKASTGSEMQVGAKSDAITNAIDRSEALETPPNKRIRSEEAFVLANPKNGLVFDCPGPTFSTPCKLELPSTLSANGRGLSKFVDQRRLSESLGMGKIALSLQSGNDPASVVAGTFVECDIFPQDPLDPNAFMCGGRMGFEGSTSVTLVFDIGTQLREFTCFTMAAVSVDDARHLSDKFINCDENKCILSDEPQTWIALPAGHLSEDPQSFECASSRKRLEAPAELAYV
eukprot:TRINITY_DN111417_c0_g1_i1.p1 TRINITY_DN111417_c0_g1~~TRINITY_DN111417_c0_g1_i1.p1  ORF type:complete len:268 (-),score=23.33 TRINITY_DN111417_c0_g1_i1:263-1066(-)